MSGQCRASVRCCVRSADGASQKPRSAKWPRRHLLTDEVLITLASEPTLDTASLEKIQGLSQRALARYGQTIMACIDAARAQGPADADAPVNLRPYARAP